MGEDDRWIAGLLIQEAEARRRDASKKEGRIPVNTEFLQRSISTTNHRDLKAAAADLKRTAAETAFDLKARELRERRSGGSPQPSCKKRRYIPPSRGDSGASTDHRRGESPDVVVDLTKEYNWVKPGLVVRVRDKASEHFRQKMVVKECAKDVCTGKIIASGANASIEIRQVETVVSKSPGRNLEVVLPSVHDLPVGAVVSLKSRHARQGKASVISKSMDGLQEYLVPLNSVCEFADNST